MSVIPASLTGATHLYVLPEAASRRMDGARALHTFRRDIVGDVSGGTVQNIIQIPGNVAQAALWRFVFVGYEADSTSAGGMLVRATVNMRGNVDIVHTIGVADTNVNGSMGRGADVALVPFPGILLQPSGQIAVAQIADNLNGATFTFQIGLLEYSGNVVNP